MVGQTMRHRAKAIMKHMRCTTLPGLLQGTWLMAPPLSARSMCRIALRWIGLGRDSPRRSYAPSYVVVVWAIICRCLAHAVNEHQNHDMAQHRHFERNKWNIYNFRNTGHQKESSSAWSFRSSFFVT